MGLSCVGYCFWYFCYYLHTWQLGCLSSDPFLQTLCSRGWPTKSFIIISTQYFHSHDNPFYNSSKCLVMIWFINSYINSYSQKFANSPNQFSIFLQFNHTASRFGRPCTCSGSFRPTACPVGWSLGRRACRCWLLWTYQLDDRWSRAHPPTWHRALPPDERRKEKNYIFAMASTLVRPWPWRHSVGGWMSVLNKQTRTEQSAMLYKHRTVDVKISRHYGVGPWVSALSALVFIVSNEKCQNFTFLDLMVFLLVSGTSRMSTSWGRDIKVSRRSSYPKFIKDKKKFYFFLWKPTYRFF